LGATATSTIARPGRWRTQVACPSAKSIERHELPGQTGTIHASAPDGVMANMLSDKRRPRIGSMFGCPAGHVGKRTVFCGYAAVIGVKLPGKDAN
jgi:hypothetical protein